MGMAEVWEANGRASDGEFEDFALSMRNIQSQLAACNRNTSGYNFAAVSRAASVEIRKLLLGDGLLRKCIYRPRLH